MKINDVACDGLKKYKIYHVDSLQNDGNTWNSFLVQSYEHVQCSLSMAKDFVFILDKNNEDGIHTTFLEWRDHLIFLGICVIQKVIKQYKIVLDKVIMAGEIVESIFG